MSLRTVRLAILVVHAWLLLAIFDCARHAGFTRTCERLRKLRPAHRRSWARTEDVIWAVDEACVWYFRRAACLQRSVTATRLLRRHGLRAEMVIGCRPLPFESHAWVEVGGLVVNDRPQYQRVFTVLDRI